MCVKILTKRNAVHAFDPFYEAIPLKQEEGVPSSGGQGWAKGRQRQEENPGKIGIGIFAQQQLSHAHGLLKLA